MAESGGRNWRLTAIGHADDAICPDVNDGAAVDVARVPADSAAAASSLGGYEVAESSGSGSGLDEGSGEENGGDEGSTHGGEVLGWWVLEVVKWVEDWGRRTNARWIC